MADVGVESLGFMRAVGYKLQGNNIGSCMFLFFGVAAFRVLGVRGGGGGGLKDFSKMAEPDRRDSNMGKQRKADLYGA